MTRRRRNIIPGHTPPSLRQLVLVALVPPLCGLMGGVSPAEARQTPQSPTRLITRDYAPDALFALRLAPDRVAQIVFPAGEEVLHAALGRAGDVELAADGRVMFLRPRTPQAASNLLVTTRRGSGELRHYAFDLSTRAVAADRRDAPVGIERPELRCFLGLAAKRVAPPHHAAPASERKMHSWSPSARSLRWRAR